jgi:hypothetical protein
MCCCCYCPSAGSDQMTGPLKYLLCALHYTLCRDCKQYSFVSGLHAPHHTLRPDCMHSGAIYGPAPPAWLLPRGANEKYQMSEMKGCKACNCRRALPSAEVPSEFAMQKPHIHRINPHAATSTGRVRWYTENNRTPQPSFSPACHKCVASQATGWPTARDSRLPPKWQPWRPSLLCLPRCRAQEPTRFCGPAGDSSQVSVCSMLVSSSCLCCCLGGRFGLLLLGRAWHLSQHQLQQHCPHTPHT